MLDKFAVGGSIIALALLSFFQYPGHTYLASDTQIYAPMLEHLWNPATLARDLVAPKPHLAFTIYDEVALGLRRAAGLPFETSLIAQQFVFRCLHVFGVYLIALSVPLSRRLALLVAAVASLGAFIIGPAVMVMELEPVPRGFATSLVFLGVGLAAQGRPALSGVAGGLAFLYHPPAAIPFLTCAVVRRQYRALAPPAIAIAILAMLAYPTAGLLFGRVTAELEQIQKLRASYNWISTWEQRWLWQYIILWALSLVALWRARPQAAREFLIGLPLIGILSAPLSYLLLDRLKWGLIPQYQPARALLFVTAFAIILAAIAACRAAHWAERAAWSVIAFATALQPDLLHTPDWRILIGAAIMTAALYAQRFRWGLAALAVAVLAMYALPIRTYARMETPELDDLAGFARASTPADSVFIFADAGRSLTPGVFRARSLRALYVDWKSGGQANFSPALAQEWRNRWEQTGELRFTGGALAPLENLDIDYAVVNVAHRVTDREPIYKNATYAVYWLSARKRSTSAREGIDDCAPGRVTEIAAAAFAKRNASGIERCSASATASAALNVSPAAVVSRAITGNAGLAHSISPSK
jgi:hypothetical protein